MFKGNKILCLSIALLFSILFTSCSSSQTELSEELYTPTEHNYKTTILEKGDFTSSISSAADIVFAYDRILYYDKTAYFIEFLVEEEDLVKKGDALASFYTDTSTVPLEEKKLELNRTQNEISTLTESYNENKNISNQILANLEKDSFDYKLEELSLQKAKVEYDKAYFSAQERIKSLNEEISELTEELSTGYLLAPFDGLVLGLSNTVREDDLVTNNSELIRLVSIDKVLLTASTDSEFRYGNEVIASTKVLGEDLSFTGHVISSPLILSQELSENETYIGIDFTDPNNYISQDIQEMIWGFNSRITLETETEFLSDVLLLDKSAVEKENGKNVVNILEDDIVKKRYITSSFDNSDYYIVSDGLYEGQIVLTE